MKKLRIRYIAGDTGGCAYYRCALPGKYLERLGHEVVVDTSIEKSELDKPQFDIYVFQRPLYEGILDMIQRLKEKAVVIVENDDNFFTLPSYNPASVFHHQGMYDITRIIYIKEVPSPIPQDCFIAVMKNDSFLKPDKSTTFNRILDKKTFRALKDSEDIKIYEGYQRVDEEEASSKIMYYFKRQNHINTLSEAYKIADAITTTTPHLVEEHQRFNKNVYLLPNYIDMEVYDNISKSACEGVNVGWAGTVTHYGDFSMLEGWINTLTSKYKDIRWVIGNDENIYKSFLKDVDEKQKIFMPGTSIEEYPNMLSGFDIGLVPLADNQFNQSKSWIKGLEYSASGIPVIASDTESYKMFGEGNEGLFLARKPKHWGKYISMLIEDEKLRLEMGRKAKEHARKYDMKANIGKWVECYEEIIERKNYEKQ